MVRGCPATGLAWNSPASDRLFLLAFVAVASGSATPATVTGLWAGVVIAWAWVAAASLCLYRATPMIIPVMASIAS